MNFAPNHWENSPSVVMAFQTRSRGALSSIVRSIRSEIAVAINATSELHNSKSVIKEQLFGCMNTFSRDGTRYPDGSGDCSYGLCTEYEAIRGSTIQAVWTIGDRAAADLTGV